MDTPAGIVRKLCDTKNDWRATTSAPVLPTERLLEKTYDVAAFAFTAVIANEPMARAEAARLAINAFFICIM
jgi:hypothetical protein